MKRLALGLVVASGLVAAATAPSRVVAQAAATAAPAPANPKLAGTWEGNYTTDGPSGGMTVVLTAGSPWTVTNTLAGDAPAPGDPREITVDGDKISWKQIFGEYDVVFKATLGTDGATMTGVLEAYQGGSYAAGGSFNLARKP